MPGFLLQDDAAEARKNVFDDWIEEQKRNAAAAAAQVQSTAQAATQAAADEVAQRRQQFDQWLGTQQAQQAQQPQQPGQAPLQPAQPMPATAPMPTVLPAPATTPTTPQAQQRSSAFDDWINQRQQDVANVTAQLTAPQQQPETPAEAPAAGAVQGAVQGAADTAGGWLDLAKSQLNKPYIWGSGSGAGGRGTGDVDPATGLPKGFDCSGYVSWVLKNGLGVDLPAQTASAYGKTTAIDASQARPGDIVFYNMDSPDPHIQHMALYVGNGRIIQAGGTERAVNIADVGAVGKPDFRRAAGTDAADSRQLVGATLQGAKGAVQQTAQDVVSKIPGPSQVADYIRYAAAQRGIDPETAVRVAQSEGLNTYTGDQGSSFGPFQLHVGGLAPPGSGNEGPGLGDAFQKATGLDPRDPSSWKQQVDYALSNAASSGWGPWHGAQRVGVGAREGIGTFKGDVEQFAQGAQNALQTAGSVMGGAIAGARHAAGNAGQNAVQAGLDTLGQGAQTVADRAQQLADQSTQLAQESARRAQQAQDLLTQTRQTSSAENERYFQQQDLRRQQQTNELLQPRQFDLSMAQNQPVQPMRAGQYGFTAPDLSGAGEAIGGAFDQLGRTISSAFQEDPNRQRRSEEARQALRDDLQNDPLGLGTAALLKGQQARLEQRADTETGNALAETIIQKAKDAGWQPEPQQEQAVHTALSTLTPMNVLMTVALGPEGLSARGLAEAGAFLGLSALGAGAGEAVAPNLPESLRPLAPLLGGFAAPVAGSVGARALPSLLRGGVRRALTPEDLRVAPAAERPNELVARLAAEAGPEEAAAEKAFSELPTTAEPDIRERLRDVLDARQEGAVNPMLAVRGATALGGGVAGYQTAPEDQGPLDPRRLLRAGVSAGLGFAAPGAAMAAIQRPSLRQSTLENLRQGGLEQGPSLPRTTTTRGEVITDLSRQGLLTNPWTQIQNVGQNIAEILGHAAQLGLGGGGPEAYGGGLAALRSIPEALRNARLVASTGRQVATLGEAGQQIPITARGVGGWVYRALAMGDLFTRTIAEYQGMAQRGIRMLNEAGLKPGTAAADQYLAAHADELYREGAQLGSRSVFGVTAGSGTGPLDRLMRAVSGYKQGLLQSRNPLAQGLGYLLDTQIPFTGTPARAYQIGIKRLPGVSQIAYGADLVNAIRSGDTLARDRALGGLTMTTMIQMAIADQIAQGNITGPGDPEHPSAARIGGQWVPLRAMPLVGLPMSIMASFAEGYRQSGQKPNHEITDRFAAALNASTKPLLEGLPGFDALRTLETMHQQGLTAGLENMAESAVGRVSPAILGEVERLTDPSMRDVSKKGPQQIWESVMAKTPGLAEMLPEKVNPYTGQAAQQRSSGLGSLIGLQNRPSSPVEAAVNDLARDYPDVPQYKDYPDSVSWNGVSIPLRPDEQRAVTQQLGQTRANLEAMINSPEWQRTPRDSQAFLLAQRLSQIEDLKTQAWLRTVPPDDARQRWFDNQRQTGRLVAAGAP